MSRDLIPDGNGSWLPAALLLDTSAQRTFNLSATPPVPSSTLALARGDLWNKPYVPVTGGTTYVRPAGPGYVTYESLYRPADSVTTAMARLTTPAIITFPEGQFFDRDFATGYQTCITIPSICRGIWGSGPGTVGGNTGTLFGIVAGSSTAVAKGWVPAQGSGQPTQVRVFKSTSNPQSSLSFGQFQVVGTEQGHVFHNFSIYNPAGPVDITDVLTTGWSGNAGAPPGETFGLEIQGASNHTLTRVEADGRRAANGPAYGGAGITASTLPAGTWTDVYSHDTVAASVVFYRAFNVTTSNMRIGRAGGIRPTVVDGGLNHEVANNIVHNNPIFAASKSSGVHATFSNDHFTATYYGVAVSAVNGSLKVVNPVYDDIWGNGYFYVQSWTTGTDGTTNDDSMTTPPLVTQPGGVTHLPYIWIHGSSHAIIP